MAPARLAQSGWHNRATSSMEARPPDAITGTGEYKVCAARIRKHDLARPTDEAAK